VLIGANIVVISLTTSKSDSSSIESYEIASSSSSSSPTPARGVKFGISCTQVAQQTSDIRE
jgi:hypothetical protein